MLLVEDQIGKLHKRWVDVDPGRKDTQGCHTLAGNLGWTGVDVHWRDVTLLSGGRVQLDGGDYLDGTVLSNVVGDVGHYHRWSDVFQGGVGDGQDQLELVQGPEQGQRCGVVELERVELEREELEREELEREVLEREVLEREV